LIFFHVTLQTDRYAQIAFQ